MQIRESLILSSPVRYPDLPEIQWILCRKTRKLKAKKIEVWFTEDNIWTLNDEDGELRLTIMATLAQNESKKTSMRVKAGQMVSFKMG